MHFKSIFKSNISRNYLKMLKPALDIKGYSSLSFEHVSDYLLDCIQWVKDNIWNQLLMK